jgi:hypothetical protein
MKPPPPSKLLCSLIVLAGSLSTSPAWSRPEATPSEIGVARRLFDEGKAAEDAGQFRAAAEKFRRAASIKDTPGIRFHLARCEEEQGAFVEALLEYDRARELIDSGVKAADVQKLLPAARERAMAKVALLTIKLPVDVSNVTVELDGKALSASVLGVAMPVNPGQHRVTAAAVGHRDYAFDVELHNGEGLKLEIELPPITTAPEPAAVAPLAPASAQATTAPSPGADSSSPARTAVLVTEATLVAAGLTTGIIFTVLRSAANDRYETANQAVLGAVGGADPDGVACGSDNPPAACADLRQAGQDRTRDSNLAAAGFVTAGASAVAFGLTYWLWPDKAAPASARATLTPGGVAFSVSGRF